MTVSAENDPRRAGTIWTLDLGRPTPVIMPRLPATFGRLGPENKAALTAVPGGSVVAEDIGKRFAAGRRCYATWVGGGIAAYGWVSFDEEYVGELNLRLRLLPDEVYIWDCATLPAFRRNHLYSALLVYIAGELRREGLCRAWIGANQENVTSQQGMARAGFRHVANMLIARVLAMRLAWVQGLPGVPDELVAAARRVFLDNRDQVWLDALSSTLHNG
jgi:ribosomal protein S18 acetylase RimI-like enzyme